MTLSFPPESPNSPSEVDEVDEAVHARTMFSCMECRAGDHATCDASEMRFCACRMEEHRFAVNPNPARAMRGSLAATPEEDG